MAYAESIAGLQLAFARQTSFAARSFSCRELDFYRPITWGASLCSASVSSQTSIEFHYASDLPLFALYANANHVLAMGARVIGRVHTVSVWVLLNVALDAPLFLIVSSLALALQSAGAWRLWCRNPYCGGANLLRARRQIPFSRSRLRSDRV